MSRRSNKEFILDMLSACRKILKYVAGLNYKEFLEDDKTVDAVVRNIEIIGEAVKNVSEDFKKKYPAIEWRAIAKTRDKLIHGYFGIDIDIVWQISTNDIPQLLKELETIITKENWLNEL